MWVILVWCALEALRAVLYRGFGYRLDIKIVSLAYADGHVLGWHWEGGKRVRNQYDDETDLRHRPATMEDSGFAVEPLYLRITCKRTREVKAGGGRVYETPEQRLRVHEHQRMRHQKVLEDYTPADFPALSGKWTPEKEQERRAARKAEKEAMKKLRQEATA